MTNPMPAPGDRVVAVKTETTENWYGFLEAGLAGPAGAPGPPGPQGPAGASARLYTYQYQSQAAPPPATGFVRTNGATAATSTVMYISKLDQNGIDNTQAFMTSQVGDQLYVQQSNDATCWATWNLATSPVDNGTYMTLSVIYTATGPTALTGNKPSIQIGIIRAGEGGSPMASQGEWNWHAAPTNGSDITTAMAGVNVDAPAQASMLFIYCNDQMGMDHSAMVESLKVGDSVFVFVVNNPDSWQQWTVIGAPVENNEVWAIPIKNYAGSPAGTEPPDGTPCVFVFRDTASVPLGGTTGQVLAKASAADGDTSWVTPAAGTGVTNFHYVQMAPATTWTIAHNLGFWPNVTVVDSNRTEIVPEVVFTNVNTVTLTFSAAVAGEAYLS